MIFVAKTAISLRSTKRLRALVVLGIAALLSLQVIASDHWHGIDDTQHCEVCSQASDAPIARVLARPNVLNTPIEIPIARLTPACGPRSLPPEMRGPPLST